MAYMALPLEKSIMPSHERPSAGYIHISPYSCCGILEPSLNKYSYPGVYVAPSLSNSLCDLGDKSMVGEESPPALKTCGNSSTVNQAVAASSTWRSFGKNFAEQYLTAQGMSGASTERAASSSLKCDSGNRGGGFSQELARPAVIGDDDWAQFTNSHAFFSNSPASMLPSSNYTGHSPPIVGGLRGGNDSTSNNGDPATHDLSSPRWHPGFGLNNIDNLPPTGSTWSILNASACQTFTTNPSTEGQALQRVRLATSQGLAEVASDPEFASQISYVNGGTCSQRSHSLHASADLRISCAGVAGHVSEHGDNNREHSRTAGSLTALTIPGGSSRGSSSGARSKRPKYTFDSQGNDAMHAERESAIQVKTGEANLDCQPGSLLQEESVERETDISETIIEYDEGAGQGNSSSAEQAAQNGAFYVSKGGTPGAGKRKTTPQEQNNDVDGTLACIGGRGAKLVESDEATAKRFKPGEGESAKFKAEQSTSNHSGESSPHSMEDNGLQPPEEPKQDYIHVRARRGQATDSHSLAERVRRGKISERMKFLQDLVPSCSKITGRAVMLDETINYVQSLQHQVEFLSMKLAAAHPQLDFHLESLFHKEMVQSCAATPNILMDSDQIVPHEHPLQAQHQVPFQLASPCATDFRDLGPAVSEANQTQMLSATLCACTASIDSHWEPLSQTSNICDGELQSVVQMGLTQGRLGFFTVQSHEDSS